MPFKNETVELCTARKLFGLPFCSVFGHAIVLIHLSENSVESRIQESKWMAGISQWQPDSRNSPIQFGMNVDNAPADTGGGNTFTQQDGQTENCTAV